MNTCQFNAHDSEHGAEIEAQLCAYNCAFEELGLRFRWDERTLTSLATIHGEEEQIAAYIETHHAHLLNAYSAEFLTRAILDRKRARYPSRLQSRGDSVPNPTHPMRALQPNDRSGRTSYEWELPALVGV